MLSKQIYYYGDPAHLPTGAQLLTTPSPTDFYLTHDGTHYQLCDGANRFGAATVDFGDAYYRARGGTEYLPKAFKGLHDNVILDATAGWGRDAWLLAYRGFQMTLVERNPYLVFLLQNAAKIAQHSPKITEVGARLQVIHHNAIAYLADHPKRFAAVYLDPMYPERHKTAQVKKPMQILHALIGEAGDGADLLAVARQSALERVVVKRPQHAPLLSEDKPSYQILAPNTRFDVYRCD